MPSSKSGLVGVNASEIIPGDLVYLDGVFELGKVKSIERIDQFYYIDFEEYGFFLQRYPNEKVFIVKRELVKNESL